MLQHFVGTYGWLLGTCAVAAGLTWAGARYGQRHEARTRKRGTAL